MADMAVNSRFSVLELDDDSENEGKQNQITQKNLSTAKNAKKRARKKKKAAESTVNTNELRDLAFSKSVSAKAIQHIHEQRHQIQPIVSSLPRQLVPSKSHSIDSELDNDDLAWKEWKNKDEKFIVDQFQKDLELALHISTGDIIKKGNSRKASATKKNPKKNMPMSLDEFSKIQMNTTLPTTETTPIVNAKPVINGYCPDELDPNHYQVPCDEFPFHSGYSTKPQPTALTSSSTNTTKKKRRKKKSISDDNKALSDVFSELHNDDKISESPTQSIFTIDPASLASWQDTMAKKDEEIKNLKETINTLKEELLTVKKRNKQLCFIIGQGEMKEKSEVLLQVDDLTNIKNELSEELAEMHVSLEQERSKVSSLKTELSKYQDLRGRNKSISEEI